MMINRKMYRLLRQCKCCLQAKCTLMKLAFFLFFIISFATTAFGQSSSPHIFFARYYSDSSRFSRYNSDSTRYSKTDFNSIDTLDKWCYKFIYDSSLYSDDSIAPICIVRFSRNTPLCDSVGFLQAKEVWPGPKLEKELQNNLWFTPSIPFKVYPLKDSSYATNLSNGYKSTTGCVPPHGGGDIFRSGNYVFVNDNFCVGCTSVHFGKIDYCRPLLNYIFSKIDDGNNYSFETLFSLLEIKKCN